LATDVRSDKINALSDHPQGAACWYFAKTREQFRLRGSLRLVTASTEDPWQHQRQQVWQAQSDKARQSYTWPSPGQPRSPQSPEAFEASPPDPQQPHPHFGLLVLVPTWVDHLELRGDPQNRYQYVHRGDRWQTTPVNP
jgi:PPOX class probable FMN-dependent enzyme